MLFGKVRQVLFAHRVSSKGVEAMTLKQICADLKCMGLKRIVYKSDQEPAIRAILNALRTQWHGELIPEAFPVGDKNSNGDAEAAVKVHESLTRTFKLGLRPESMHRYLTAHP